MESFGYFSRAERPPPPAPISENTPGVTGARVVKGCRWGGRLRTEVWAAGRGDRGAAGADRGRAARVQDSRTGAGDWEDWRDAEFGWGRGGP